MATITPGAPDSTDEDEDLKQTDVQMDISDEEMTGAVGFVKAKFQDAEDGRQTDEARWLLAHQNYLGKYSSKTQFRESEKSRVFVKITKTKVLAAYGQIIDILFANSKFPISVEPTPIPEGIAEFAHKAPPNAQPQVPDDPYGFAGDGQELPPGSLGIDPVLGGLSSEFQGAELTPGPAKMGEPQIEPAKEAARNMQKTIYDQLTETSATTVLRHSLFETVLLGTGIVKGPFNSTKQTHRWVTDDEGEREYTPKTKKVPVLEAVSVWDFYPDPSATSMEDVDYVIQRHKLNKSQLRALGTKPLFNKDAISTCLSEGPNYETRGFESTLYDGEDTNLFSSSRYEVFEYWGTMDIEMAEQVGIDIDDDNEMDYIQVNLWVCGNHVLRAVLNPFTPDHIPYYAVPYEISPYNFWGVGIPENMEDAQIVMNGHMRMAIDNLALAGNLVFDIDETMLVPGQSMKVFPGKQFRRQSGQTGQAVHGIKFPNTAPENIQMYDKARQLADEETGIPSIMHGQTGVSGTGRTAAGLSMLLSSANLSIKTVIKNIDDFLLKPMGEAYFRWNMQFNAEQPDIVGDLEIKARGTSAVMQKEVRSQRLTTLLQTVSNPMLAPFVKIPNLMKELAIAQDIDPDSLVNDMNQAAIFADILRGLNATPQGPEAAAAGQQPGMEGAGVAPVGANPADASGVGGGNIGTGNVPLAGESGSTANTGGVEG